MRKRKKLSLLEKSRILGYLIDRMVDGQLPWGTQSMATRTFWVYKSTISALWACYKKACKTGGFMPITNLSCGRSTNGRPIFYDRNELLEQVRALPVSQCMSIQDIANNLGVLLNTIARVIKNKNLIFRHANKIKPVLTEENCIARVEYCLDKRDWGT